MAAMMSSLAAQIGSSVRYVNFIKDIVIKQSTKQSLPGEIAQITQALHQGDSVFSALLWIGETDDRAIM